MQKTARIIAIVLLLISAVNALVAGALFILDPSGGGLGMSVDYLRFSPFRDYRVPGIVLFTVLGWLNLYVAFVTFRKKSYAPVAVLVQGVILIGWIVVQVRMVRDLNALHVTMFTVGTLLALCGFALLPGKLSDQPTARE